MRSPYTVFFFFFSTKFARGDDDDEGAAGARGAVVPDITVVPGATSCSCSCLGRGCTHPNATNFSVRTGVLHTRQRRPGLRKREVLHRDTPRMNSIYIARFTVSHRKYGQAVLSPIALHLFFPPVPGADLPPGYLVRHRLEHGGLLFWPSCRSHA